LWQRGADVEKKISLKQNVTSPRHFINYIALSNCN